jgi:hypothetical protein
MPSACRLSQTLGRTNYTYAMSTIHTVTVVDGPTPAFAGNAHEPDFATPPQEMAVLGELLRREPLFHRPEFGLQRSDFERMAAPGFWEIGASGRCYSRQFVIDTLVWRYQQQDTQQWEIHNPCCMKVADDNYLMVYTLVQGQRVTRRSTIWRRSLGEWQVVFHQGTEVA